MPCDPFADVPRQLEEVPSELNQASPPLRRGMPAHMRLIAEADRLAGDETAGKVIRQICQMKRLTQ
jgi:hypothetical protein